MARNIKLIGAAGAAGVWALVAAGAFAQAPAQAPPPAGSPAVQGPGPALPPGATPTAGFADAIPPNVPGFLASRGSPPMPALLQQYRSVTPEMLANPGPNDWLQNRRTYDGQAYSPLEQINTRTVKRLKPVWVASTSFANGHQAAPLVNNGVMFVSTPGNQVMALNAATGVILWRYRIIPPEDAIIQHPTSRGVALLGDKVFFAAGHGILVALDAKTGREVWKTTVLDNKAGYYMSLAPLVADGKVMIGTSGGERGVRGFIAAYDVESGKEAWRTFTVPEPGQPGSETWPQGDQWKTGGAPIWIAGNYDVKTGVAYWGTGNGGPWMGDQRPGDNLYTASTVAVNVKDGKIVGHHQYTPNESFDWDETSPPILLDYRRDGQTVNGLLNVARNGYMWWLERAQGGAIKFRGAQPYVYNNVFKGVDANGRPEVDLNHKPATGKRVTYCPSHLGGKNWPPVSFSPKTRLLYVPANNGLCTKMEGQPVTYRAGQTYTGSRAETFFRVPNPDHVGEVQAWNVDTGRKVWTHNFAKSANWGPTMVTAGNLVFAGGTNDRKFRAFDAATGKVLWEQVTGSGVTGMPSTFMVGGKQYVAVMSGWGLDARGMQNALNGLAPGEYPEVPEGGAIWVFALED